MKYLIVFLIASQACLGVHSFDFNTVKNTVKRDAVNALNGYILNGLDVNMVGPYCNKSLLMWAAISGATQTAKVLLQNGANANLVEKGTGMTALMYAVSNNNINVMRVLKDYNSDKYMTNSQGKNAMDIAKIKGYYEVMVEVF